MGGSRPAGLSGPACQAKLNVRPGRPTWQAGLAFGNPGCKPLTERFAKPFTEVHEPCIATYSVINIFKRGYFWYCTYNDHVSYYYHYIVATLEDQMLRYKQYYAAFTTS